jgi:hypothetical protein
MKFAFFVVYSVCGTVVGRDTMLQGGKSRVQFPTTSLDFSIGLNLPTVLGPGVDSATNRNEYHEFSWGKGYQELKADLTAICQHTSRKCRSIAVSKPYEHPRPITLITLSFFNLHAK